MTHLRIGVRLESLGQPLRRALEEAGRLGVAGVQADAVGDLAPDILSQTGRRELRHLLRAQNLELAALGCPLRRGLDLAHNQEARIDHVKKVLSLSFDLGPRLVIVQGGSIPADSETPAARGLCEAVSALGRHADRVGAVLALVTGLESALELARFLDRFDTGTLGASLDPANMLIAGFDPVESGRTLGARIKYVVARDTRQTGPNRSAEEVPLGHGDIDWMQLLGMLEEIEYRGWLTIARDSGDSRLADVASGVAILRRLGV
jgi:sugar phosphate isomerase/epimerase